MRIREIVCGRSISVYMEHPWELEQKGAQEDWERFLSPRIHLSLVESVDDVVSGRRMHAIFWTNEYCEFDLIIRLEFSYLYPKFILKESGFFDESEDQTNTSGDDDLSNPDDLPCHRIKTADLHRITKTLLKIQEIWSIEENASYEAMYSPETYYAEG